MQAISLVISLLPSALWAAPADDSGKAARLAFMDERLDSFSLTFADKPERELPRTEEPVLRFSNPVRDSFSDGAIFLWRNGARPVAVAGLWIRGDGESGWDFVSLSAKPLRCTRDGEVVWSPKPGNLVEQPLPDAPSPAASAALRLVQMRQLARRFTARARPWPAEGLAELRLMPQPIRRYSDEEAGIVDGAIFAFAQANDPELLLVLELLKAPGGGAQWHYTLARMTAVRVRVQLDERDVWSVDGYWNNPRSLDDPYIEALDEPYVPDTAAGAAERRSDG